MPHLPESYRPVPPALAPTLPLTPEPPPAAPAAAPAAEPAKPPLRTTPRYRSFDKKHKILPSLSIMRHEPEIDQITRGLLYGDNR